MAVDSRLNWSKWLYIGETEGDDEQSYHFVKRRRHMLGEHTSGVVWGCRVLATSPTPDMEVHVQVGRVIDPNGEDVNVEAIEDVDLTAYAVAGATVYIVAEFDEVLTDAYVVPETGTTQYKYYEEVPTISAQTAAPGAAQIELARVVVSLGATQIFDAGDNGSFGGTPLVPVQDEINQTNRTYSFVRPHATPALHQPIVYGRDVTDDAAPKYMPEWFAGWKVLDPNNGTVAAQLTALGVVAGDRFWLLPGAYTLGADVDISVANVLIAGPRLAVISVGAFEFTASGIGTTFKGITITADVTDDTNSFIIVTGTDFIAEDVLFTYSAAGDKLYHIDLQSGADRAKVLRCRFNEGLGVAVAAAHVHVEDAAGLEDVLIHQCTMIQSSTDIDAYGVHVGTTAGYGKVTECTFVLQNTTPAVQEGIYVESTKWLIQGNTVVGSGNAGTAAKGITLGADADDCRVIGNEVNDVKYGVDVDSDSNVVSANTLRVISGGDALNDAGSGSILAPNIEEVNGTAGAVGEIPGRLWVGDVLTVSLGGGNPVLGAYAPTMGETVQELASIGASTDVSCFTRHAQVSTTDATVTALWTFAITAGITKTWMIKARVLARRTGGAAGDANDSAGYERTAVVKNVAGTISVVGATGDVFTAEDQAGWNCTIDVSALNIRVMVTGAVNNNVDWIGQIEVMAWV